MDISTAIETLEWFIRQDRIMRDYDVVTDYEQFCEDNCMAIEITLNSLERSRDAIAVQDKFILEIFNDKDINDTIKGKYMEKYNKMQISIK